MVETHLNIKSPFITLTDIACIMQRFVACSKYSKYLGEKNQWIIGVYLESEEQESFLRYRAKTYGYYELCNE